jgi:AcrR family transcriptional regulator
MPRDASETRRKLLDAAALAFAENGVRNASLVDITRRAGQRNSGALHYHFGSREGVLCAVLEEHVDFLATREGELLALAREKPVDDVASVVEAVVRPAAELAESGWRGRCFLLILADVVEEDPANFGPELNAVLARTGGQAVYDLLIERMPTLPPDVLVERLALMTMIILRSVADRARNQGRGAGPSRANAGAGRRGRPQLSYEAFVGNLVAMVASAVATPDPGSGPGRPPSAG